MRRCRGVDSALGDQIRYEIARAERSCSDFSGVIEALSRAQRGMGKDLNEYCSIIVLMIAVRS